MDWGKAKEGDGCGDIDWRIGGRQRREVVMVVIEKSDEKDGSGYKRAMVENLEMVVIIQRS
jgi:hypothetical protein